MDFKFLRVEFKLIFSSISSAKTLFICGIPTAYTYCFGKDFRSDRKPVRSNRAACASRISSAVRFCGRKRDALLPALFRAGQKLRFVP